MRIEPASTPSADPPPAAADEATPSTVHIPPREDEEEMGGEAPCQHVPE